MTTNHVEQMKPGDGIYVFFLNAQGRILADAFLLCFEDHFLLDTDPETRRPIFEHLDRYIIADDVTLTDITGRNVFAGPRGPEGNRSRGEVRIPRAASSFLAREERRFFRRRHFGDRLAWRSHLWCSPE